MNRVRKTDRDIGLTGVHNARQLGGYLTGDGRRVRGDVLIRSGKLMRATDEDIRILTGTYRLKEVFDFRTRLERESEPDPHIPGVKNVHIPILDEAEVGSVMAAAHVQDPFDKLFTYIQGMDIPALYVDMSDSSYCREGYHQFFQQLLEHREGAVLWHCTAGKDRVGLGTALLLSALGVDRETILEDFALSDAYYGKDADRAEEMARARNVPEEKAAQLRAVVSVNRDYMERALNHIDQEYGTVERYLKEAIGLSDSELEDLKGKYLEG